MVGQPRRSSAPRGQRRLQGGRPRAPRGRARRRLRRSSRCDRALLALQGPGPQAVLAALQPGRRAACASWTCGRVDFDGMPARGVALGLYRRGRLRDLARRRGTRPTSRERLLASRRCCRSGSARAICCGSRPGSASTATTSTRRPRRSRRRWSGRSSRRAAPAARGRAAFRAPSVILGQIAAGAARRRVGLRPEGRAPMREGTELFAEEAGEPVGTDHLGRLRAEPRRAGRHGLRADRAAAPGTRLFGRLRGKMLPVTVARMPLIEPGYKRA